ncbi:hypothetical protein ACHAXH_009994 [Discostella pseudostelligera]
MNAMVDKFHHDDGADKQVDDLREQMRLLQQDRRANIDLLEANKVATGNEIRSLKEDNSKLRTRLSNLQKSAAALEHDFHHSDVDGVKKAVLQKRNEFDTQKSLLVTLTAKLNKVKDESTICRIEEQRQGGEPLSRQIRSLENRLDTALIQYNEAQGICSTYEHIVKRLKDEKVGFDNQLTALERTLESKHQDFEELVLLSGDASHAREIAFQNLQKSKCELEESKNRRSRDLRERQQHTKIRKQMIKKLDKGEDERARAPSNPPDGNDLYDSVAYPVPIGDCDSKQQQLADQEHLLNVYETAFRKIKDVTGVSDVNDMIRKVIGQESTTENVQLLTAQNQTRIEYLTRLRDSLVQEVDNLKHANSPAGFHTTKAPDERQDLIYLRSSMFERTKNQFDRMAFLLISIKAGVGHLREKITVLPKDTFEVGQETLVEHCLPDIIRSSGNVLLELHTMTKDKEFDMYIKVQDSKFTEFTRASRELLENRRPMTHGATEDRPFNQRISLRSTKGTSAFGTYTNSETDFGEFEAEEEISRDGVKKASSNIIAMEERRKLRSTKPDVAQ